MREKADINSMLSSILSRTQQTKTGHCFIFFLLGGGGGRQWASDDKERDEQSLSLQPSMEEQSNLSVRSRLYMK